MHSIKNCGYLIKEKIEYILFLAIQSTNENEYDFGYNLLTAKKIDKNDIEEFNKSAENKINFCTDGSVLWNKKGFESYQNLCLNNLKLYEEKKLVHMRLYNYDYYKKKHKEKYHFELLKQFYKKILPSKCFESAYNAMYDEYYPFNDQEFTNDFVDNNLDFIPMENDYGLAMTDKFSMRTLINGFLPKINGGSCDKITKIILQEGFIIAIINHEMGHNFVNVYFFMSNSKKSIETPRKNLLDMAEGGAYLEIALFGRILETINLNQALYLMNEKNYDRTYLEFQEGFNNLKDEDLKIDGIFKDLYKEIDLNDINSKIKKNLRLPLKKSNQENKLKISWMLKNDVVGRRYSDKAYAEFYKKFK